MQLRWTLMRLGEPQRHASRIEQVYPSLSLTLTKSLNTGKQLSTLSLRLTMQYGELDNHVVTTALERATKTKGRNS